jgi:hypothetical protein
MSRIRKTEHAGAKNGGGHWGTREEAKTLSKKLRRSTGKNTIQKELKVTTLKTRKSSKQAFALPQLETEYLGHSKTLRSARPKLLIRRALGLRFFADVWRVRPAKISF